MPARRRAGDARHGRRDHRRGVAQFSRPRRPAADTELGDDAERRARAPARRAAPDDLSGARDRGARARLQFSRRWASGSARSTTPGELAAERATPEAKIGLCRSEFGEPACSAANLQKTLRQRRKLHVRGIELQAAVERRLRTVAMPRLELRLRERRRALPSRWVPLRRARSARRSPSPDRSRSATTSRSSTRGAGIRHRLRRARCRRSARPVRSRNASVVRRRGASSEKAVGSTG